MLDAGSGDFIAEKSRREDVVGSKNNLKSSSSPNALSFYRRPGMPSSGIQVLVLIFSLFSLNASITNEVNGVGQKKQ